MFSQSYFSKLREVASELEVPFDEEEVREARREFRKALAPISKFKELRDVAGGHMDADVDRYLNAVESFDYEEVMDASYAAVNFGDRVLKIADQMRVEAAQKLKGKLQVLREQGPQ